MNENKNDYQQQPILNISFDHPASISIWILIAELRKWMCPCLSLRENLLNLFSFIIFNQSRAVRRSIYHSITFQNQFTISIDMLLIFVFFSWKEKSIRRGLLLSFVLTFPHWFDWAEVNVPFCGAESNGRLRNKVNEIIQSIKHLYSMNQPIP